MRDFTERMTAGLKNAESVPDEREKVMVRPCPEENRRFTDFPLTLLVPKLSLNLSHNLSGRQIQPPSDSVRASAVMRDYKQTF